MGRMKSIVAGRLITLIVSLFALAGPALAQKPTQAQIGAIRQACRSDYQTHCSNVPTGGSAALPAFSRMHRASRRHASRRSARPAVRRRRPRAEARAGAGCTRIDPAGICLPSPSAADVAAAGGDAAAALLRPGLSGLCGDVPPGGGRIIECLRANGPSLSRQCRSALMSARQGR